MTEFVSEPIKPVARSLDTARMSVGEPGLPEEFIWRGQTYKVKGVTKSWKTTGPCTHGSGEMYVRRHYYEIETESGETMVLYCDRRPPKGKPRAPRWWLYKA